MPFHIALNPSISDAAFRVYAVLRSHEPNINCSIPRICDLANYDKKTVLRAIKELVTIKRISIEKIRGRRNRYKINHEIPHEYEKTRLKPVPKNGTSSDRHQYQKRDQTSTKKRYYYQYQNLVPEVEQTSRTKELESLGNFVSFKDWEKKDKKG